MGNFSYLANPSESLNVSVLRSICCHGSQNLIFRETMKVTICTFSLTGNTKLTAKRIAAKLTDSGKHTVDLVSLVKLGKEVDSLGVQCPLLGSVRASIQASDVVALGCFSNGSYPSHRVNEMFAESVLPAALFTNMKYFFVFATAGKRMGRTLPVLATLLFEKNSTAKFLGELSIIAPQNWPAFLPERPFRDTWDLPELIRADEFGVQLLHFLDGDDPIPDLAVAKTYPWRIVTESKYVRKYIVPRPVCDHSKCLRCGTCAGKCPYNAITINSDIEDGFPVFNRAKCEGCSRCFHKCPAEAIEMPKSNTQTRTRYPQANLVPAGQKCADGMISQPLPVGNELRRRNRIGKKRSKFLLPLIIVLVAIVLGVLFVRK
jgi:ferredoxin